MLKEKTVSIGQIDAILIVWIR